MHRGQIGFKQIFDELIGLHTNERTLIWMSPETNEQECIRDVAQLLSRTPKQATPLNVWMMSMNVLRVFSKLNSH